MNGIDTEYRVPYADTDQMGYVYYANYLVYFERGRNELMRSMGFTYKELESLGIGLPVAECQIRYHIPARYDDRLTIHAELAEFKGLHLVVACKVLRDGVVLAEGHTRHAFVDMATGRPVRIPQEVRRRLEGMPPADGVC
jgi:acyl-CoA thioester hydrolase